MHFLQLILFTCFTSDNFPERRAIPSHDYAVVMGQVLFQVGAAVALLTSHKATGDGPAMKPELFVLMIVLMIHRPASYQY